MGWPVERLESSGNSCERPTNNVKKPPILPRRSHSPAAPRSQSIIGEILESERAGFELPFEWIIVVEKGKNEYQLLKRWDKIKMLT
jgi:hypothetical protein